MLPAGYRRCKHKQCNVYCENDEVLRRHVEDFKYHRRHFKQLGDTCQQCKQLAVQPLWRRIIEYRELIYAARNLLDQVAITLNAPPTLGDDN